MRSNQIFKFWSFKFWLFMFSVLLFFTWSFIANAVNYYVDSTVLNDLGDGSFGTPKKYIQSGIVLMSPTGGDTLIIKDGTYTHSNDALTNFISGSPGNYNIIKAQNDGGVVIDLEYTGEDNLFSVLSKQYLQFEGLKIISQGTMFEKRVGSSNHIKILRCAFEGGTPISNTANFSVGGGSHHILIEDSWFYGSGSRHELTIYEADYVVLRRLVIRHDHGWSNVLKTDPEGSATVYNSNDVEVQNVIIIDSVENSLNIGSEWVGAITLANNGNNNATNQRNNIRGTIALNVSGNAFDHGGWSSIEDIYFEDVVVWWSAGGSNPGGGALAHSNESFKSTTATRMTIGNQTYAAAIWGGENSTIKITNSIIYNMLFTFGDNGDSAGIITDSNNNCYNENGCSEIGLTTFDPFTNGLEYLPRVETGSNLDTSVGGRVGARITNRIGISGSLWGEPGYKTLTAEPLWPWPNEARIHADMSGARNLPQSSPANRGFATPGQTLTKYIWEALGNAIPEDISQIDNLPIPQNLVVTDLGLHDQLYISWDTMAGATGYEIYRATTPQGAFELIHSVMVTHHQDTNCIVSNALYYYKIKAMFTDSSTSEFSDEAVNNAGGLWGDINADNLVDGQDLAALAQSFNTSKGDMDYQCHANIDRAGLIDHDDLLILAENFGNQL